MSTPGQGEEGGAAGDPGLGGAGGGGSGGGLSPVPATAVAVDVAVAEGGRRRQAGWSARCIKVIHTEQDSQATQAFQGWAMQPALRYCNTAIAANLDAVCVPLCARAPHQQRQLLRQRGRCHLRWQQAQCQQPAA